MNRRLILLLLVGVVLIGAGAIVFGLRRSFRDRIDRETTTLIQHALPPAIDIVRESDLTGLPEPVQHWLRASGVVGSQIPKTVRLTQTGEFRLGPDKPWMPFHATQHYAVDPPGFLWNVSMRMARVIGIEGRDRYFEGTGSIEMNALGAIPVANASGGQLDEGALLRYLNEMMWFPAAMILPNITWEPIDETQARATITDGDHTVSAVFVFDDQYRLIDMTAARWNDAEQLMLPWSTPLTDWGVFEGISMPIAGRGWWSPAGGEYDYIRLQITNVEYGY